MVDESKDNKYETSQEVIIGTVILTSIILGSKYGFTRYLKQYKEVKDIPSNAFKKRWLYGKVTAVGDGDNFRFFHTPGGILGGWYTVRTVPSLDRNIITSIPKKTPVTKKKSSDSIFERLFSKKNKRVKDLSKYYMNLEVPYKGKRNLPTISVRLCGIDAPERAYFGGKTQPFGDEVLNWLRYKILGKRIWIKPLSIDQYNRCVARAVYWSWLGGWKDVSYEMLKEGLATVFDAKTGSQFDGREKAYRVQEFISKSKSRGMWAQRKIETPAEYKKRLKS